MKHIDIFSIQREGEGDQVLRSGPLGTGCGGGGLHPAAEAKCAMCARRRDRSYGAHPCRTAAQVKKGLGVESKSRERLLFFLCTKVHKHGM